jgi:hypothetical protein
MISCVPAPINGIVIKYDPDFLSYSILKFDPVNLGLFLPAGENSARIMLFTSV